MSKKHIVLIILFILPVVIYLFFASGVYNFTHLPEVTKNVSETSRFKDAQGNSVSLSDKVTLLGFLGNDVLKRKSNVYNLHQEVYKGNYIYDDTFQVLMLMPEGTQDKVNILLEDLSNYTEIKNWKFAFGQPEDIKRVFNSLKGLGGLANDLGTSEVFIIDKERNVRCNTEDKDLKSKGYNTASIAVVRKKLDDDLKMVIAEYKLALKKNYKVSRRDSFLKINEKKKNEK
ncbi:hypothetical protein [Pseudofulvibacter geojedonensis]|uniref:Membrane or secreted protein n=1 Tax=Pseudofulvibacter geojedonensis TaxID=1123758 RepID=A0ABW3I214_9FLAO